MYQDKTLVCRDCGAEFVFTAGEQEFYAEKGFQNEPTRCKECRTARKASRANAPRESYETVCAACGKPTTSPSCPRATGPSIAANASPLTVTAEKAEGQGKSFCGRVFSPLIFKARKPKRNHHAPGFGPGFLFAKKGAKHRGRGQPEGLPQSEARHAMRRGGPQSAVCGR